MKRKKIDSFTLFVILLLALILTLLGMLLAGMAIAEAPLKKVFCTPRNYQRHGQDGKQRAQDIDRTGMRSIPVRISGVSLI